MTLAADLKNLKRGDVLVLRDGTRKIFSHYCFGTIVACDWEPPFAWAYKTGRREHRSQKHWDIVRVIKAKPAKPAKPDKDAAWLLRRFSKPAVVPRNSRAYRVRLRIRKIAKRLEAMK